MRVDDLARILRGEAHVATIGSLRAKYPQHRKMNLDARPVIEIAVMHVMG